MKKLIVLLTLLSVAAFSGCMTRVEPFELGIYFEPREAEQAVPDYIADLFYFSGHLSADGIDFLNVDFGNLNIDENNAHLIQFARRFDEMRSNDDWETFMLDAGIVRTLLLEAFGIDLPLADVGMYKYDANENAYAAPFGEPGLNPYYVRPSGVFDYPDGSTVMIAELIWSDYANYLMNYGFEEGVPYALAAYLTVTYIPNENYEIFPVRILNISSPMFGWPMFGCDEAEGIYLSPDGAFTLQISREDSLYSRYGSLNAALTVNASGETFTANGSIFGNGANVYFYNDDFYVDVYITLSGYGPLIVSVFPEWAFGGEYTKIGAEEN
jgi:hypothetical protein